MCPAFICKLTRPSAFLLFILTNTQVQMQLHIFAESSGLIIIVSHTAAIPPVLSCLHKTCTKIASYLPSKVDLKFQWVHKSTNFTRKLNVVSTHNRGYEFTIGTWIIKGDLSLEVF